MEHQIRRASAALGWMMIGMLSAAGAQAQPASEQAASGAVAAPPLQAGPPPPSPPPPAWALQQAALPPTRPARADDAGPPVLFRRPALGGYGGVGVAYTQMFGRSGALIGFEGALLIGHRLSLGLAGYGFSRTPRGPAELDGTPRDYGAGYGGFMARYALFNAGPLYVSLGLLLGGGAAVLHRDWDQDGSSHSAGPRDDGQADGFFVAQPELALHVNVTRFMRVGLACGYRATSGVQRLGLSESDVNGVVLGGSLQFGWI